MNLFTLYMVAAATAGVVMALVVARVRWRQHRDAAAVPPRNVQAIMPGRPPIPLELVYGGYHHGRWHWYAVSPGVLSLTPGTVVTLTCDETPPRTTVVLRVAMPAPPGQDRDTHPTTDSGP